MLDERIVDMYWARSEYAISATSAKYGGYCLSIAFGILRNREDSEECVNDTYLRAWNSMPEARPKFLSSFLGRITRNLALNRFEYYNTDKRGRSETAVALDELGDCLADSSLTEDIVDSIFLAETIEKFLGELGEDDRNIFLARYWFFNSVKEIAENFGMGDSRVKVSLHRSREKLKKILEKEGIEV